MKIEITEEEGFEKTYYTLFINNVRIGECTVDDDGYLHDFRIFEEYRGKKYGKYFFMRVLSYYKNQEISLCVYATNDIALRIYRYFNFKTLRIEDWSCGKVIYMKREV